MERLVLYLLSNELTKLSKEVCSLSNLKILNLGRNKLTELPKDIENPIFVLYEAT